MSNLKVQVQQPVLAPYYRFSIRVMTSYNGRGRARYCGLYVILRRFAWKSVDGVKPPPLLIDSLTWLCACMTIDLLILSIKQQH